MVVVHITDKGKAESCYNKIFYFVNKKFLLETFKIKQKTLNK